MGLSLKMCFYVFSLFVLSRVHIPVFYTSTNGRTGVVLEFVPDITSCNIEGDIGGLRYCGIGQFFMRYFGNFNLELRYCGILQTCGMRFLDFLVDDSWYKNVSFTFFRPFLAVSGRFGSNLKRPCVLTTSLSLVTVSIVPPLVIASILSLDQRIRPLYRLTKKLRYFPNFFLRYCDICRIFLR